MNISANTVRTHSARLARFAGSSVCVLVLKIGLLWLFERVASPRIAYALTHAGIFLASYLLHSVFTFRQPISWRSLASFFRAVAGLKLLDYLLFSALVAYVSDSLLLAVGVTGFTFVIRYVVMRATFHGHSRHQDGMT